LKIYRLASIIGFGFILAWSFGSCKKKAVELAKNEVTIQSVNFSPAIPLEKQDLTVNVNFFAPQNQEKVTFSYKWFRDGELLPDATSNVLPGSEVRLGSEIYVSVQGRLAGNASQWVESEKVKPIEQELKITNFGIVPDSPHKVDKLEAKYNCEGCESTRFYYRWYLNGQLLKDQTEATLDGPAVGLNVGDSVYVEISPDPNGNAWRQSSVETIMARLPELIGGTKTWVSNNTVYFQFHARDPEGGNLNYQLVDGPQGTTLNGPQGQVSWPVPEGFKGAVHFKVRLTNSYGKEAFVGDSINLELKQNQ